MTPSERSPKYTQAMKPPANIIIAVIAQYTGLFE
jgi:hypothetical protein